MMAKRVISFVLALVMVLALTLHIPIDAKAATVPGNVCEVKAEEKIYELFNILGDGSYFTVNQKTCTTERESSHGCTNCSLSSIIAQSWFTNKFGTLSTEQFPRTYYSNSNSWKPSGRSCFAFATFAEWYIYANTITDKVTTECVGTFNWDYDGVSANIRVGDLIRLQNSKGSQSGHSAIAISYDKTGVRVLDSNGSGKNCEVHIRTIEYSSYNYYVISRATNSVTCDHKTDSGASAFVNTEDQLGVCTECGYVFDWESTFSAASAGTYTVKKMFTPRTDAPYDDATSANICVNAGTTVEVVGTYKNAYGSTWYKFKLGGAYYYVYGYAKDEDKDNATYLTFKNASALQVTCSDFSPANNAVLEKKSYPVTGTVTSNLPLKKIEAYLDGSLFATWTAANENTTTVSLRSTAINTNLKFSSLSTGKHTVVLKAWDYVHGTGVQFHSSVFYIEEATCTHSYSYKVTVTPTISSSGTLTGTCTKCSALKSVTLPKLSTTDYNYSVTKAATCTASGTGRYTWKTTTYGSYYFDVTISAKGHSYTSKVTAPTCTAQGYTTYSCSCGYSYKGNYTSATGHNCSNKVIAPTCTAQGYTIHSCACGYTYQDSYTNATGHSYSNYGVKSEPTTTSEGAIIGRCSRCGDSRTVTLPKLSTANYNYAVIERPTSMSFGTGRYTWFDTTYGTFSFDVRLPAVSMKGDADGDGYVDAYDASLIKKFSVGAIAEDELNLVILDLDGDGFVDAYDASLAQKFSVGAIDKFPIEE